MNTNEYDYLDDVTEDFPIRNENRTRRQSRARPPRVKLPPKVQESTQAEEQAA